MKYFGRHVLIIVFIFSALDLLAGPTIIRDNRITDLSTTPVLGRGYSIGTNTFQSTCMEKVVITEPSYDMKYSFTQLEDRSSERRSTTEQQLSEQTSSQRQSSSSSKTSAGMMFLPGLMGGGIGGSYNSTRSGIDSSIKSVSKSTVIAGKTYYSHSMLVTISLYSYYASLDESRSRLSEAAKSLLQSKDIPGFFSSCGPYYVRSIGRNATFVSIFTYQTETTTRDESFESQLRTEVSRFSTESKTKFSAGGGLFSGGGAFSVSTNKSDQSKSSRELEDQKRREEFNSKSESYRLTINTSAYGLGKDKKATLISFDMGTYKTAVKDAFMSMQNPRTGKVSSIEVVPWVENTEFQAFVPLEEEEIPNQQTAASGDNTNAKKPKTRLLYEKKHILNQNAEFFMEIERSDRNKMNMYYKARLCKKNIDVNFKEGNELKAEYAGALLINHRGGASITLEFLTQKLTDDYVAQLLKNEKDFMYGDGEDAPGAADCIREIMTQGIYNTSYREIEVCQPILEQMGDIQASLLENFCMPEIAGY